MHLSFSKTKKTDEPALLGTDPGESADETAGGGEGGAAGELTITVKGAAAGRATETVAADVPEGTEFASCFNPLHLLEGAEVIEAEKIRFLANDAQKPVLISGQTEPGSPAKPGRGQREEKNGEDRPAGFLYLAMPRRDPEAKAETSPKIVVPPTDGASKASESTEEAG